MSRKSLSLCTGKVVFIFSLLIGSLFITDQQAMAHWCSNIYNTHARIVVKPERDKISIAPGTSGILKVRVRNMFPYTLATLQMRAQPTDSNFNVDSTMPNKTGSVLSGEERTFTLSITNNSGSTDSAVSVLNIQINATVEYWGTDWQGSGGVQVNQSPSPADVSNSTYFQQHESLNWAAYTNIIGYEQGGVEHLITRWNGLTPSCESTSPDGTSTQDYFRAGQALAIRMRFLPQSSVPNSTVRNLILDSMLSAMDTEDEIVRGLAAFLAAYSSKNDSSINTRISNMASSDPLPSGCSSSNFSNADAMKMARAAMLLIDSNSSYKDEVRTCATSNSIVRVRMVCSAAMGMVGEDPTYLISSVPTGARDNTTYSKLIASALLQLVVLERRGGPNGQGLVGFLNEEVVPDNTAPKAPTNVEVQGVP